MKMALKLTHRLSQMETLIDDFIKENQAQEQQEQIVEFI